MGEQPSGPLSEDLKRALAAALTRDAAALLRFAAVLTGSADAGRSLSVEVLAEAVKGGAGDLERVRLFEGLRRRGALHVDRERRRAQAEVARERPRPPLSELRPTEREALLLRYVSGLGRAEVAGACGVDEAAMGERLSRGLLHACRPGAGGAAEVSPSAVRRRAAEDRLVDLLDGLAPDEVADFAAEDDVTRDLVHDAEQKVAWLHSLEAGLVVDPGALEAEVLALIGGTSGATASPAPASPPPAEAVHEEPEVPVVAAVTAAAVPLPAPVTAGPAPAAPPGDAPAPEAKAGAPSPPAPSAVGGERGLLSGPRGRLAMVAFGAAALAALALYQRGGSPGGQAAAAWAGEVEAVRSAQGDRGGLERCSPDREACSGILAGDDVPAGSTLRTDARTRAVVVLKDGTRLSIDRATEVRLDAAFPRRARLERGGLVVDVAEIEQSRARLDVPLGFVETEGAKLAVDADARGVGVEVVRGSARLVDEKERGVGIHAGEEGHLEEGRPPVVMSTSTLGRGVAWSEHTFASTTLTDSPIRGLGELRAQKPGEDKERKGAVTLASHTTRVRIVGSVARTEIEEEFTNGTDEVLEGIYRFPLPPDAQIERLALDVDGKLEEGAFVDRERASAIWRGAIVQGGAKKPVEEIVWVPGPWKDPALLEWQRGGRFELRIYPIPKRASRRVVLAYTQVLAPSGSERRYTYPLPHDPSGTTRVGRFALDVQVRGHDPGRGVRVSGYELRKEQLPEGAESHQFTAEGFVPTGDLSVEFSATGDEREVTAWAYRPGPDEIEAEQRSLARSSAAIAPPPGAGRPGALLAAPPVTTPSPFDVSGEGYVAFALRPRLPQREDGSPRSFALVVDSSRSMFGERYRRASDLASRLVREMDRSDRVTVLACDSMCAVLGPPARPSADLADRVAEFLRGIGAEGGSDVTGAVRRAREELRDAPAGSARIVYIGDGTPTIGAVQPAFVGREIAAAVPADSGLVTTVAIGADADVGTLAAVAQAGGGVLVPYVPGQALGEAAYAVLGATYGSSLGDVEVEVPDGVVDVVPRRLANVPAGSEVIVVGRLTRPVVEGTVRLRGRVAGAPFEQRYPLRVEATTTKGNAFVPRLWAGAKIADLEKEPDAESRREAVSLSGRFHVASRFTSLLVLESDAMFRAFGLDRSEGVARWTGESDAESAAADGQDEVLAELSKDDEPSKMGSEKKSEGEAFGRAASADLGYPAEEMASRSAPKRRSAPRSEEDSPMDFAPAPKAAAPASPPMGASGSGSLRGGLDEVWRGGGGGVLAVPPRAPPPPRRRMVPMRKVWERVGRIVTPFEVPRGASPEAIAAAEQAVLANELRRDSMQKLFALLFTSGDVDRASQVAERWSAKDPLDPDALTARADVAAVRGERDRAIRILGSVVDVRPGDYKAQWRLARLHRWAGRAELGCRHSLAVAQIRSTDGKLLAEAVRCQRDVGRQEVAESLLSASDAATRRAADALLVQPATDTSVLSGDFRLEANWEGGDDLDLSMLGSDGARVSWLGAPTKAVITARDVTSTAREGLALKGASPGDYVIELTRPAGHGGSVRGTLDITAAGDRRKVPFVLDGVRTRVALVKMTSRSKLVPL